MKLSASCLCGVESLTADELRYMGCSDVKIETGRVLFEGGAEEIAKTNIRLRTAERVQILAGEFPARSFDELFEGVKALSWEEFIQKDSAFPVKGHCLDSALMSVPDCQRIIKKAMATKLASVYSLQRLPETGSELQIRFTINKNIAAIYIDTSGAALHKRGYRPASAAAPLRETLAAAMVKISRYKGREVFCDPFCGSGTIAIEAALAAKNRAPGISRRFAAQDWGIISASVWDKAREEARASEYSGNYEIFGSDIDSACVAAAGENASRAGVSDTIRFFAADALSLKLPGESGILMLNPPYGERLLTAQEADKLIKGMGNAWRGLTSWKKYILSSSLDFERSFGMKAQKRRKLYNGMIQCQLYMYY